MKGCWKDSSLSSNVIVLGWFSTNANDFRKDSPRSKSFRRWTNRWSMLARTFRFRSAKDRSDGKIGVADVRAGADENRRWTFASADPVEGRREIRTDSPTNKWHNRCDCGNPSNGKRKIEKWTDCSNYFKCFIDRFFNASEKSSDTLLFFYRGAMGIHPGWKTISQCHIKWVRRWQTK